MAHRRRRKARRARRRRVGGDQSFAPSVISGTRRRRRRGRVGANSPYYHGVKRHKRRSRKIGAMKMDSTVQTIGGVVVGALAGMMVNKFAPEKMKGKMLSSIKTIGGGTIAYMGRKQPFVLGLGLGIAANGATEAAKDFGIIKGIDEFMSGIGAGEDALTIEMNGTPENAGKLMGAGEVQTMPSVISGVYMSGANQEIPSVISNSDGF